MRRAVKKRHTPGPDQVYNSVKVTKLINYIMIGGGKETARKVVYQALDEIREKTKTENPVEILEEALRNVSPQMEVRSRRVGGANYQVPREVRPERRLSLAIRWIAGTARSRKGMAMYKKLAEELIAAANNEGEAVKKKENMHKMAEANRAFAHFAW